VYGVILGVFMYLRFARGRWKSIRLDKDRQLPNLSDLEAAVPVAPQN
jgi:hypothetical protein